MTETVADAKRALRKRVWDVLAAAGAAEPGVRGTIPAFTGAAGHRRAPRWARGVG